MVNLHLDETLSTEGMYASIDLNKLSNTANTAIRFVDKKLNADLTIALTGDEQIQELHWKFLGRDNTTDVLAFPSGETDLDSDILYLGDVVISYPQAVRQAAESGHTVEAELQLLIVHGVLHLFGYDHSNEEQKSAMWEAQSEILDLLECPVALF